MQPGQKRVQPKQAKTADESARKTNISLHPLSLEDALRGVIATGPMDDEAKMPARKSDEPNSPHHAEHDNPAERVKTATRKAGEQARRVKRKGASGIRGGTSED